MTFIPTQSDRKLTGDGDVASKIAIVGEISDAYEQKAGRLFVGPMGSIYEQCLHSAHMTRGDVYATNLFKVKDDLYKYYTESKGQKAGCLTAKGAEHIDELKDEIAQLGCNIIVAMGEAPCYVLTGRTDINSVRGYIFPCVFNPDIKVIPTLHPRKAQFDYILRHYISHDIIKAQQHSNYRGVVYSETNVIGIENTHQATEWYNKLKQEKCLSVDIEVSQFEISHIGFTSGTDYAVVYPFSRRGMWSLEQEVYLWELMAGIMEDANIAKVGQNFIFDMYFLALQNGIVTKGRVYDTMVRHSIAYPEFLKGLNFLVSIYCNRPYWKDMVNWKKKDKIKAED